MIKLSVNVNKIATVRNSRGGQVPSVIEREHDEFVPVASAGRDAMEMFDVGIFAYAFGFGASVDEILKFLEARHGWILTD